MTNYWNKVCVRDIIPPFFKREKDSISGLNYKTTKFEKESEGV